MSLNKKAALLVIVALIIGALCSAWCLSELFNCIKDIKNTNAENTELSSNMANGPEFGKRVKSLSFWSSKTNYDVAENSKYFFYFCKNQYMQLTKTTGSVRFFYYEKSPGTPAFGEKACSIAAVSAVKECFGNDVNFKFAVAGSAFDGKNYTFSVLCGNLGYATVKVSADSGKISMIDMRNVNGF